MLAQEIYWDLMGIPHTTGETKEVPGDRYEAQANLIQWLMQIGKEPKIAPDSTFIETSFGTCWRLVFDNQS